MSWTDWFSRKNPAGETRPSLRDVTFDTRGLMVEKKTAESIQWRDTDNDRLLARFDRASAGHPFEPCTLEASRTRYRQRAASRGGGIVSVEFGRANGIPITKAISKFEDLPAYLYEGTVMISFREALYSVTLEASERGTTGTREAVATSLLFSLGELKIPTVRPPDVGRKIEGWTRDPYDEAHPGPALHSLSDDERLDDAFPAHPLSKIRRWFISIERTLTVAHDLHKDLVEAAPAALASSERETRHRMPSYAIAILYLQAGRLDLAEPLLVDAVPLRDGEPVLDGARVGENLILLGVTRESLGRMEDAIWALSWAVRAFRATAGDRGLETVRARANLARVYAGLGRHEEAEPLLTEVVPIFEAEKNDSELSLALNAMGLVRQAQGRHTEAMPCFERTLALFETLHGPDFFDCATVLRNIARSADALGDVMRSKQALKRAEKILRGAAARE
jgi:tetratricopeptide (TPR) repeat protein